MNRRAPSSVLVKIDGPEAWSYWWPEGPTVYLLNRAARALKRLTPKQAPDGTYTITINGESKQVVKTAVDRAT